MSYTPEQQRIIALYLRLSRGRHRKVRKSLLLAGRVESNFGNPSAARSDPGSEGGLQQRPDSGWGPASEPLAKDVQQYLERAGALMQQGFRGTAGQLAQAVQRSAYPERYDEHRAEATALLRGSPSSGGGTAAASLPGASTGNDPRLQIATDLIGALKRKDAAGQIAAMRALKGTPAPAAGMNPKRVREPRTSLGVDGELEELIFDPLGSIFDGVRSNKPYGGHDKHVHVADDDPKVMLAAIKKALAMGLHVGENPYTTGQVVRSGHAAKSWHKQEFKGRYNGKLLGKGADVSGDARRMAAYFRWLAQRYG